jgi:hypothetical protein
MAKGRRTKVEKSMRKGRRKNEGFPRPGGDFVAPGKKAGFPRPGGSFVAPGNTTDTQMMSASDGTVRGTYLLPDATKLHLV